MSGAWTPSMLKSTDTITHANAFTEETSFSALSASDGSLYKQRKRLLSSFYLSTGKGSSQKSTSLVY